MKLLSVMELLVTVWNKMYKTKSYCSRCKKDTENINPRVSNTSTDRTTILSKCAICGSKNQDLLKIRNQKDY